MKSDYFYFSEKIFFQNFQSKLTTHVFQKK